MFGVIVYVDAGCDVTINISVTDNLSSSEISVKLLESVFHKGYVLYVDN
jgi:hypothetical protein